MNLQQGFIAFVLIIALIGAFVAFIRTPKERRYSFKRAEKEGEGYAPEYTKKEKLRLVIKHLAWAVPFMLITNYYLRPAFDTYAAKAECYNYKVSTGIHFTGVHVVYYGTFVGLSVISALVLFIFEGPRSIRIIKLGQNPLPNEKVFKPTKYRYGARARIKPVLFFVGLAFFIALSIYGVYQVNKVLSNTSDKAQTVCAIK